MRMHGAHVYTRVRVRACARTYTYGTSRQAKRHGGIYTQAHRKRTMIVQAYCS